MSAYVNGYYVEYVIGSRYCTVHRGKTDEYGRLALIEMVFRSETWDECIAYAQSH